MWSICCTYSNRTKSPSNYPVKQKTSANWGVTNFKWQLLEWKSCLILHFFLVCIMQCNTVFFFFFKVLCTQLQRWIPCWATRSQDAFGSGKADFYRNWSTIHIFTPHHSVPALKLGSYSKPWVFHPRAEHRAHVSVV